MDLGFFAPAWMTCLWGFLPGEISNCSLLTFQRCMVIWSDFVLCCAYSRIFAQSYEHRNDRPWALWSRSLWAASPLSSVDPAYRTDNLVDEPNFGWPSPQGCWMVFNLDDSHNEKIFQLCKIVNPWSSCLKRLTSSGCAVHLIFHHPRSLDWELKGLGGVGT